jgi:hypothetical protein
MTELARGIDLLSKALHGSEPADVNRINVRGQFELIRVAKD